MATGAGAPTNSETDAVPTDTPFTTVAIRSLRLFGGGYSQTPPTLPFESRQDQAQSVSLDSAGNSYISGIATSRGFPTTTSLGQSSGPNGCFVIKLDADGKVLYSVRIPGTDYGVCLVAADASGNAYVTGGVSWGEFQTTPGAYQRSLGGSTDVFVAKLNPTGTALVYSTLIGGPGYDLPAGIVVDGAGNAVVTGSASPGFPVLNAFQQAQGGVVDAFIAKLNADASALTYSTFLGGSGNEAAHGIALGASGDVVIAGETESPDFPAGPNSSRRTPAGDTDAFAARISASGALVYATVWGGAGVDRAFAVAAGPSGTAYATGAAFSAADSIQSDVFVTHLSASGAAEEFRRFGGAGDDGGRAIAVDGEGSVYVAGSTASDDFPTRGLAHARNSPGLCANSNHEPLRACSDTFVAKFDSRGAAVYSTYLTGGGNDAASGLALDAAGHIYISGTAQGGFPERNQVTVAADALPAPQVVTMTPSSAYLATLDEQRAQAAIDAVVSGASFLSGAAPGGIVTIFGAGLVSASGVVAAEGSKLPLELAGTSVSVNGIPAPLYAVAKMEDWDQINLQIPFEVGTSSLNLQVATNGVSAPVVRIPFAMTQAAVFTWEGGYAVAQHPDYSLVTRDRPARPGEIIMLYGSGLGPVEPAVQNGAPAPLSPLSQAVYPPEVIVGEEASEVLFAGLSPGSIGLGQINVRIPPGVAPGDVALRVGNQTVKMPVGE